MNTYADYLLSRLKDCPPRSLLQTHGEQAKVFRRELRERILADVMGIAERSPVRAVVLEESIHEHFRRQSLVIECEPDSWQTAQLYLPRDTPDAPMPGIVLASGHGGSKAHGYNQIAAQLYVRLGCAVLLGDPIGEEERHDPYGLGLRGHRRDWVVDRMNEAGRPFLGKVVYDLRAGLDYLRQRQDVDASRLACAGSSMGGTLVQLLVAVESGIRAAIISSWAADYRSLDGAIGCCYRLPGLMRHANQLELMAMAAPECALMVCAGAQDEVTPPSGLKEMGEKLEHWWEQCGAGGKFACLIEETGGHRPYHMTPEGIRWMAKHLGINSPMLQDPIPLRSIADIYAAVGRKIEPLYDHERHHKGTRIPDWPVEFESADSLRVLTPERLEELGLTLRNFTLDGYLEKCGIPGMDSVSPLPAGMKRTPEAAGERVSRMLASLAPEPEWLKAPAGEWKREKDGKWSVDLGFAGCRLRVKDADEKHRWLRLARKSKADGGDNRDDGCHADVDLVSFNDNEVLLGEPSLFTNLYLVRRAFCLLEARFGRDVRWSLRSEVPRLGELSFFVLRDLQSLYIASPQAVEKAGVCVGRVENVIPGLRRYAEWLDVLLALAPRPVSLPCSYLSPGAMEQLAGCGSFNFYRI